MNCIKIDLPKELTEIEIHTLADLHMGDKYCDYMEINKQIASIKDNPNAYCILNGDLMNNATKTSISDCYAEQLTPMQQINQAVELLRPIYVIYNQSRPRLIGVPKGGERISKQVQGRDAMDIDKGARA